MFEVGCTGDLGFRGRVHSSAIIGAVRTRLGDGQRAYADNDHHPDEDSVGRTKDIVEIRAAEGSCYDHREALSSGRRCVGAPDLGDLVADSGIHSQARVVDLSPAGGEGPPPRACPRQDRGGLDALGQALAPVTWVH